MARGAAPIRTRFASSDQLEARAFIHELYGGRLDVQADRDTSWHVSLDAVEVAGLVSAEVRLPAMLDVAVEGLDDLVVSTVRSGAVEHDHAVLDRARPGDVLVTNHPALRSSIRTRELRAHVMTLPAALLAEAAGRSPDEPPPAWHLRSFRPLAGTDATWRQVVRHVDGLLTGPGTSRSPLVVGQAARLAAGVALSLFPTRADGVPTALDRRDAGPASLRRAVALIESHPDRDLTLLDLAGAAGTTTRAVQLAFRRHLGTTPMAYLRRVRLEHAHAELQAADPAAGTTVREVARRWGFADPGRFAAAHREAFGEAPGVTLRS